MTLSCRDDSHDVPFLPFTEVNADLLAGQLRLLADTLLPDWSIMNIRILGRSQGNPVPGLEINCAAFSVGGTRAGEIYISALTRLIKPSRFITNTHDGLLHHSLISSRHGQSAHKKLEMIQQARNLFPPEDPIWRVPDLLGGITVLQSSIATSISRP